MEQIDGYRGGIARPPAKANPIRISNHLLEISLFVVLTSLLFGVLLIFLPSLREGFNGLQNSGLLGDFVGGFVGTIFTIASVLLLLSNLRNQIAASKTLNFENKYFELVKMHRDNVSEFQVGIHTGRKVFVSLVREFQAILFVVRNFKESGSLSQTQLICVAYYALFFGVGPNSSRMLSKSLIGLGKDYVDDLTDYLENEDTKARVKSLANLSYEPLDGHQSRLGHYYRHLYQTVSYVDVQPLNIEKYDYVKTIRAQLTNYEQAFLLINSLTPLGQRWWDRDYLKKYRMVQNIPQDFFNPETELNIRELFDGENDFEWQEHSIELIANKITATAPLTVKPKSLFE